MYLLKINKLTIFSNLKQLTSYELETSSKLYNLVKSTNDFGDELPKTEFNKFTVEEN